MTQRDRLVRVAVLATRGYGAAAAGLALAEPAVRLAIPAVVAAAVDAAAHHSAWGRPLMLLLVLLAAATLVEIGKDALSTRLEAIGADRLRSTLLTHVLAVGPRIRARFSVGDLVSRVLDSVTGASRATPVLINLVAATLIASGGVIALFLLDPLLGLLFVVATPAMWLLSGGLIRRAAQTSREYQAAIAQIASRLVDAVAGARSIHAYHSVDREIERVLSPLPQVRAAGAASWAVQRAVAWRVGLLVPTLQIGVLATAGWCLAQGRMSPGELLAAPAYLGHALGMLRQMSLLAKFAQVRASAARAAEVINEPAAPPAGRAALPSGPGTLTWTDVEIHRDGEPVLRDVNLCVPGGTALAVVGRSGSGKSFFAWVAAGLWPPCAGTVRLDGMPLSDLGPDLTARGISCAFERPTLLGETVTDALRYGDEQPPAHRVADALRVSAAHDFVHKLPDGPRTAIADLRLSGGELQRLGLARAVCRSTRVIVMDDATASMDAATEARVLTALATAAQGRTRIIVTHRATTAARADRVAWLDNGTVRAVAPHTDLLAEPEYRALFALTAPASDEVAPAGGRQKSP